MRLLRRTGQLPGLRAGGDEQDLHTVQGRAGVEAVSGISGVTITIPPGAPLPDGDQYLGFIFAGAGTPDDVEKALITASQQLRAVID
jgi:L-amino acid ligase C-terminal domain 2